MGISTLARATVTIGFWSFLACSGRKTQESLNRVVVFDDSDRLLQRAHKDGTPPDLLTSFFSGILPWLTEMRCGFVCAANAR